MNEHAEAEQATEQAAETPRGKRHRMPRQGNVHATIFENHGANGSFHTVDFQRRYMDGETAKFTHSFRPTDMDDVMKQAAAVQETLKQMSQGQGQAR